MKKVLKYLPVILATVFISNACTESAHSGADKGDKGVISLNVSMDDGITEASRSVITNDSLVEALKSGARVRIWNSADKLVRLYTNLATVPDTISLTAGNYKVAVTAGDSTYASFDKQYFKGENSFTVSKNVVQPVNITCKVANSLVDIDFDSSLEAVFDKTTYSVKATNVTTSKSVTFDKNAAKPGYFMFPAADSKRAIALDFTATTLTGQSFSSKDTIFNALENTKYAVTIKYSVPEDVEEGGGSILIIVDETVNKVDGNVEIYQRPSIKGNEFDIDAPLFIEPSAGSRTVVWLNTSSQLVDLSIASESLSSVLGLSKNSYEFCNVSVADKAELLAAGISYEYSYNASTGQTKGKIVFSDACMKNFVTEGAYDIIITAKDYKGYSSQKTLNVVVSTATVAAANIDELTVYSNRAVLQGSIIDASNATGPYSFNYRVIGGEWVNVPAVLEADNVTLTATITGLTPATMYQYRAVDNDKEGSVTKSFTTESASQLYNAGFEDWTTDTDGAYIPASSKSLLFWDTGNHGSITLSKNVTNADNTTARPGSTGTTSAKLTSQFVGIGVIGKFAAGNIFAGSYGATNGTNATLNMGRPFTSRPKAFKFWYKYNSGVVDYAGGNISKGEQDIASIYCALGDWDSPVVINSADQSTFFNASTNPHIIAYGSFEKNTTESGWTEVTVNLDYRVTDKKPTYMLLVMSASKYGDYFAGSTSSVLWVDDIELIY